MGGLKDEIYRKKPGKCEICGAMEARYLVHNLCDVCATVEYLKFRHAMNWPLDESDKKRLGLM